jgi:hypothetical protein
MATKASNRKVERNRDYSERIIAAYFAAAVNYPFPFNRNAPGSCRAELLERAE